MKLSAQVLTSFYCIYRWSMIFGVSIVLNRTVVDSVNDVSTTCAVVTFRVNVGSVDLISQLSRDVIGRLSVKS